MTDFIVVGYDGTPASDIALLWAGDAAERRQVELRLITAWVPPATELEVTDAFALPPQPMLTGARAAAESVARAGVRRVSDSYPGLSLTWQVLPGPAAGTLVESSIGAEMLVVGTHDHGHLWELLLGSVSRQVVTHAKCPVVVARPAAAGPTGEVAVGVDGSESSLDAMEFAFRYASSHNLSLRVVAAWSAPMDPVTGVSRADPETLTDTSEAELRVAAEELAGHQELYPDVPVTVDVMPGDPADVLAGVSAGASLVVVGSRGLGGFGSLLLGSVSHSLAHRAECPVAVVR